MTTWIWLAITEIQTVKVVDAKIRTFKTCQPLYYKITWSRNCYNKCRTRTTGGGLAVSKRCAMAFPERVAALEMSVFSPVFRRQVKVCSFSLFLFPLLKLQNVIPRLRHWFRSRRKSFSIRKKKRIFRHCPYTNGRGQLPESQISCDVPQWWWGIQVLLFCDFYLFKCSRCNGRRKSLRWCYVKKKKRCLCPNSQLRFAIGMWFPWIDDCLLETVQAKISQEWQAEYS